MAVGKTTSDLKSSDDQMLGIKKNCLAIFYYSHGILI
jgi:hypothetical protein